MCWCPPWPCMRITINEILMIANKIKAAPISLFDHASLSIAANVGAARLMPSMDGSVPSPNENITSAPEKAVPAAEAVKITL